ncbi:uncharacterized protein CLUP02_13621 [Colletotrichum lupini]|uniref:Uncharacterized protein n=1 Tax=Colletotrichum lupini TaxID=145971 RepID=A0A9Q8T2N6_9PEZI|nr:uncharacterized protein CLUP02_13621 [Colletotrichum lupini]UQC88099.1 hypothetical protein CLUP02_13621 [Colletotrichum lupini]
MTCPSLGSPFGTWKQDSGAGAIYHVTMCSSSGSLEQCQLLIDQTGTIFAIQQEVECSIAKQARMASLSTRLLTANAINSVCRERAPVSEGMKAGSSMSSLWDRHVNATCSPMQSMASNDYRKAVQKSAKPKKIAVRAMEKAMPIKQYRECHLERVNKGPVRTDYSDGGGFSQRYFHAYFHQWHQPVGRGNCPVESPGRYCSTIQPLRTNYQIVSPVMQKGQTIRKHAARGRALTWTVGRKEEPFSLSQVPKRRIPVRPGGSMPGYKEWDPRITDEAPGRAMSAEGPMVVDGRHGRGPA